MGDDKHSTVCANVRDDSAFVSRPSLLRRARQNLIIRQDKSMIEVSNLLMTWLVSSSRLASI